MKAQGISGAMKVQTCPKLQNETCQGLAAKPHCQGISGLIEGIATREALRFGGEVRLKAAKTERAPHGKAAFLQKGLGVPVHPCRLYKLEISLAFAAGRVNDTTDQAESSL